MKRAACSSPLAANVCNEAMGPWEQQWQAHRSPRRSVPGLLVDAACDAGASMDTFAQDGCPIIGLSFLLTTPLRVGRTTILVVCGDLTALPFGTGRFDRVVSIGAVDHRIKAPSEALPEPARVTRPCGMAATSVLCLPLNRLRGRGILVRRAKSFHATNPLRRLLRKTGRTFFEWEFAPRTFRGLLVEPGWRVQRAYPIYLKMGLGEISSSLRPWAQRIDAVSSPRWRSALRWFWCARMMFICRGDAEL